MEMKRRSKCLKSTKAILVVVASVGFVAYINCFLALNGYAPGATPVANPSGGILHNQETSCGFPILDAFDDSIKQHIKSGLELKCDQIQPDLTFVDPQAQQLSINNTALDQLRSQGVEVACTYRQYDGAVGPNDNTVQYDAPAALLPEEPVKLTKDFVSVTCTDSKDTTDRPLYQNDHVTISNLSNQRSATILDESENHLSVLLVLVDSMSLSAAKRYLPKTFRFLTKVLGSFILEGYNKVGDNSFPNMIPILTGKRPWAIDASMPTEFEGDLTQVFVDDWPIIWRNFSEKGYVTAFNEDEMGHGLFNNPTRGFMKKPTDHFFKPFWLQVYDHSDSQTLASKSSPLCFGNSPIHDLQAAIIAKLLRKYAGKRKFSYNFFTGIGHDRDYELQFADETFLNLIQNAHESDLLNRTVLIFGSDHGHRFSPVRETLIGVLEERMPLMSLTFPKWFLEKHRNIRANLKENTQRLTANFDLHETLADILNSNFGGKQRDLKSRGLSLLYPVPVNRTCQEAGIPKHYCTCATTKMLSAEDPVVIGAAAAVVAEINDLLRDLKSFNCSTLNLASVTRAELLTHNTKVVSFAAIEHFFRNFSPYLSSLFFSDSAIVWLRIAIRTAPGDALFEATLQFDKRSGTYRIEGGAKEISRLNSYANQATCLKGTGEKSRQKYCICASPVHVVLGRFFKPNRLLL